MNITSVAENVLTATDQLMPSYDEVEAPTDVDGTKTVSGQQLSEQIETIVGIHPEQVQEYFDKLLREKGVFPPNPNMPVPAGTLAAAYIVGMAIGVRAAQLAELDELDDIPTLDDPV